VTFDELRLVRPAGPLLTFITGDRVRLASGGPTMTVGYVAGERVVCSAGGKIYAFDRRCLVMLCALN
jgi:uncharacterized protein YodC (DUF2158 family)